MLMPSFIELRIGESLGAIPDDIIASSDLLSSVKSPEAVYRDFQS
jgi:hypothetical protein